MTTRPRSILRDAESLMAMIGYGFAVLFIAALVHFSSVLALPHAAPRDAYARIAQAAPVPHRFTPLPRPAPGAELLPLQDPMLARAACRFDLSGGPVRVRVELAALDGLLLLSFHDRQGSTFHATTDRGALRGRIDIRLVTPSQLQDVEAQDPDDETPQDLRLLAPSLEGFILAGSLALDEADMEAARRRLSLAVCASESDQTAPAN
jgi:uncharacterized membrane protein